MLDAQGALLGGTIVTLTLSNALENTNVFLISGSVAVNVPFKGGTLVPAFVPPDGLFIPFATDGFGGLSVQGNWPAGVPAGFTMLVQAWIQDAAGPFGCAASNANAGTTP